MLSVWFDGQRNLTMLGKVCLRRNEFLFFQSEGYLKVKLDSYNSIIYHFWVLFMANKKVFFGDGIISDYVEYW